MSGTAGEARAPGAPAAAGFVPLSVPEIRGNEWLYVKECLDTGWVSSAGEFVNRFEAACAEAAGRQFAVATISGTAALHVALLLAGVEPEDEVLVPSLTFIAPHNAIRYAGAWPVFLDSDPENWQLDPARLADFLQRECARGADGAVRDRSTGRRVSAVLPVDVLGHPADLDAVVEVADAWGLAVVEDAAEALGARYRGRRAGSAGLVSCLSFNGNKLVTTGGGGAIVTDDAALAERARYLTTTAKDDPVSYVHGEVGFNYRLSNVAAAIGVAQLEQLDDFVGVKRRIAARYRQALADVPGIQPMPQASWAESTFWLYTVLVDPTVGLLDNRQLLQRLEAERIQSRPLWEPGHLSRAHAPARAGECTTAERLSREALSLPSSIGLSGEDQERVIDAMRRAAT